MDKDFSNLFDSLQEVLNTDGMLTGATTVSGIDEMLNLSNEDKEELNRNCNAFLDDLKRL